MTAGGIPREPGVDSSLALLSEGYTFVSTRAQRHRSDIFRTRVMLREAFFVLGEEASRVFYEPGRFTRQGAVPLTALKLLQDKGSVQLLDGEAHRYRKRLFTSLMDDAQVEQLTAAMTDEWLRRLPAWSAAAQVVLFDELQEILCRAACRWAGIRLTEPEARRRNREIAAMLEGAARIGPRNWAALLLRTRTERWAERIVRRVRSGLVRAAESSPLHTVASHRDLDGRLVEPGVAAVELLNLLRPITAVARLVVFAALALHREPGTAGYVRSGDRQVGSFVQEVRRFYPFFPSVGGRVARPFDWRGHHFPQRTWFLLDLYGTNHDPRMWDEPGEFRADRFEAEDAGGALLAQGGGPVSLGHRCPGEEARLALMRRAVRLLTTSMRYSVPNQDLDISLGSRRSRTAAS